MLIRGDHVEHWLNGAKVFEYELGSDAVEVGASVLSMDNASSL